SRNLNPTKFKPRSSQKRRPGEKSIGPFHAGFAKKTRPFVNRQLCIRSLPPLANIRSPTFLRNDSHGFRNARSNRPESKKFSLGLPARAPKRGRFGNFLIVISSVTL